MIAAPTYTTYPGTDLRLFRCEPLSANLSTVSCAQRHRDAQTATGDALARLVICRSCVNGAAHAGVSLIHYSWLYGSAVCSRCGHGTTRMVRHQVCVSCYTREREVIVGKNAQGKRTIHLRRVVRVDLHYRVDGAPRRHRLRHATGRIEAMAHVLRNTAGEVMFFWHQAGTVPQ